MTKTLGMNRRLSMSVTRNVSRYGRGCLYASLAIGCASAPARIPPSSPQPPAPAGQRARDFAQIEKQVLVALNEARTSPATARTWLQELAGFYDGTRVKRPWWPIVMQTTEGVSAVREAITALESQPPVPALTTNAALASAARDHVNDQARTGAIGHAGSDGSTTSERVGRYATWQVSIAENIDYQPMVRGRDVIESLLVDDGVPGRGHRHNIYQATARLVGIACGPHPKYEAMCVIVQTGGVSAR